MLLTGVGSILFDIIVNMQDPQKESERENSSEDIISCAWNPDDEITLEWWGRAEGINEEQ